MKTDAGQEYAATVKVFRLRISYYHSVDVIYVTNLSNTTVVLASVTFCSCNAVQATGTDPLTSWTLPRLYEQASTADVPTAETGGNIAFVLSSMARNHTDGVETRV
jgi:hypothetical protein